MNSSVLITGANGTIGRRLVPHLCGKNYAVHAVTRAELDLSAPPTTWGPLPKVDVAVLAAAASKLDFCEDHPEEARSINVTGMQALTERLQANGAFILFLSTNQVFDGEKPMRRADEPPCPHNEYGRQKAAFEAWLMARSQPAAVLRLTKVVDGELPIVKTWREKLCASETIEAFTDLRFAPLPMSEVLRGIEWLAGTHTPGIHQLSGGKEVSYFEIAQALARELGVNEALVKPVLAVEKSIRPQFLPPFGSLQITAGIR